MLKRTMKSVEMAGMLQSLLLAFFPLSRWPRSPSEVSSVNEEESE